MDREPNPFDCDHEHVVIRRRTYADGRQIACRQCLRCGSDRGAVPKKAVVFETLNPFDQQLLDDWNEKRNQWWKEAYDQKREAESEEWWQRYQAHLDSPKWRRLADKVLARCKHVCEGCADARAVHVHHLTYAHLGDELLYELVGLCVRCHSKAHGRPVGQAGVLKGLGQ